MTVRYVGLVCLLVFSSSLGCLAAIERQMYKGDWSFRSVRVPAGGGGTACVKKCEAVYDRCLEVDNSAGGRAQECADRTYSCMAQCPRANENIAQGKDTPGPIEERACKQRMKGRFHCVTVAQNNVVRFWDP